ncbi:MAG: toxin-antitoxin system protein [Lachnospiraceae bacterium]|nr:toxin-antitoxin system protein [Lachnospiraceae bacterium]
MKPLKCKVSVTLDEDIVNQIKELAEQDDRSFSQYVNLALKEHISKAHVSKNHSRSKTS